MHVLYSVNMQLKIRTIAEEGKNEQKFNYREIKKTCKALCS